MHLYWIYWIITYSWLPSASSNTRREKIVWAQNIWVLGKPWENPRITPRLFTCSILHSSSQDDANGVGALPVLLECFGVSFGALFHTRIQLVVDGLDFICKLQSSSVQFSYPPLISRAQEFRVISLTADLETQDQVLMLLYRVSYCIHYCSLQARFHINILPPQKKTTEASSLSPLESLWGIWQFPFLESALLVDGVLFGGRRSEEMRWEEE